MMAELVALSVSPFAAQLMAGSRRQGTALGHGYALFGEDVLAVTSPGTLRMPNGVEADVHLRPGESLLVGQGELCSATAVVRPGPLWNPRPRVRVALSVRPGWQFDPKHVIGRGPGLTPLGDDVLIGLVAGEALAGGDTSALQAWLVGSAGRTTALSLTLLRRATRGELPEAAHRLLENGDPVPLVHFGATSGKGIALGLALALDTDAADHARTVITFALPPPVASSRFDLRVGDQMRGTKTTSARSRRSAFAVASASVGSLEGEAISCMSCRR